MFLWRLIKLTELHGYKRIHNLASSQAQAQVLVFLDSNVECTPGWLQPLLAIVTNDRSAPLSYMCSPTADVKDKNVNYKTQIIGFASGKLKDIYPSNGKSKCRTVAHSSSSLADQSDSCLWTEWFDHDTPCNSDGDKELHEDHFLSLEETWTGSMRICKPKDMMRAEHYGGSESTLVDVREAKEGRARGFTGKAFKQNVHVG